MPINNFVNKVTDEEPLLMPMVHKEQSNCLIFRSAAKLTEMAVGTKLDTSICRLTQKICRALTKKECHFKAAFEILAEFKQNFFVSNALQNPITS